MTMEPAALGAVAREAILVSLILSAPLVGAAAVVGLARKFHEQQVGSLVPWRVVIRI